MKIFLELQVENRGLQRVYDALVKYKPDSVEIVKEESEADLVIIHVYGRHDSTEKRVKSLIKRNIPYVMIQYCLRSTMNPSTKEWIDMWENAKLVWSYYYLPELCFEDGIKDTPFPFYFSPLGADPTVFYDRNTLAGHKACVIATCSAHALSESVRECVIASQEVGKKVFHLGHDLRREGVFCKTGITDSELAYYYSCCEFVSGLRRTEGFELPAVEGLLCGARPILFDKPHYRQWYEGLAVFIPEGSREDVIISLIRLFERGAKPVTEEEKEIARQRFNWENIIGGFYQRILV